MPILQLKQLAQQSFRSNLQQTIRQTRHTFLYQKLRVFYFSYYSLSDISFHLLTLILIMLFLTDMTPCFTAMLTEWTRSCFANVLTTNITTTINHLSSYMVPDVPGTDFSVRISRILGISLFLYEIRNPNIVFPFTKPFLVINLFRLPKNNQLP